MENILQVLASQAVILCVPVAAGGGRVALPPHDLVAFIHGCACAADADKATR